MSSDIKKLLSILDESTTAGSVASVSSKVGGSPLKRSKDTIFAAENSEQTECATDTTSSPSNFGLWKNSASLSTEQRNKHGRKHSTVDRSVMYPQLSEASFKQRGQEYMDNSERALKSRERNVGLNEPDELPSGDDKYSDLGTWHFKYDDGRVVMKNGKPLLTTSKKNAKDIVDRASKAGHTIEIVGGAPADKQLNELSSKTLSSYKKKAGQSASEADKRGDFAKGHKRFKGINKATKREFDNDARGVKEGVAEGSEDKVVFQGHTIGHIETDSDGDPVGIVYSNNPQSKRPFEIYGYEDVNHLKQEMISQWNKRVPKGVAEGEYNPDTFVGKKGTYKGYGITQEGPSQWGISSSARKFPTLNAAKRHIDKVLVVSEQGVAEGNPGYNKHSFVGRIRRGREADNKGWEQLGNLFAAGDDEKAAEKALRKGNRYYNMTRGSNKTPGGFPKTTFEGVAEGERMKTASGMYRDQHTGVAYRGKTGQDGNDSYMTPDYLIQKYQERLAQIASGPYKRPKEIAQLKSRIAKLQGQQGVAEGSEGFSIEDMVMDQYRNGNEVWEIASNMGMSEDEVQDIINDGEQGVAEGSEITEEMIADRLKDELALFKSGTKSKDKAISKKPADREVQPKKDTKKDSDEDK